MPYIKQEDREHYKKLLEEAYVCFSKDMTEGELNYVITSILNLYVKNHGVSYKTYNEVMGVMESAKQEFYRRNVAPYEDLKIRENGDV
jgi:hypothetical protein